MMAIFGAVGLSIGETTAVVAIYSRKLKNFLIKIIKCIVVNRCVYGIKNVENYQKKLFFASSEQHFYKILVKCQNLAVFWC